MTPEKQKFITPKEKLTDANLKNLESKGFTLKREPYLKEVYRLSFHIDTSTVTIVIDLQDPSNADVVITNMTTLPRSEKGKGFGSQAIKELVVWAKENDLHDIRAVQVQDESENFWLKNGFRKLPEPNPTNDFIYEG